jgi:hypothetical protein
MRLTKLSSTEASTLVVGMLGLDVESIDLGSVEGVAGSIRRAASFLCPTSPARLIDAVLGAVGPLAGDELSREDAAAVLEQLIATGDIIELRSDSNSSTRLLYLAPPSYIERQPGSYIVMGIRPFGAALLEGELARSIQYEGHTRLLFLDPADAAQQLQQHGLQGVRKDRWVSSPAVESPEGLINRYQARLSAAREAGQIEGLAILDPSSRVHYYRGRWRPPATGDTGDYVARRPQEYGADLWCLVRLLDGTPQGLLELPLNDPLVPGRDEAWRYQAAVDALRGAPQRFRVRPGASLDDVTLDFFAPLPGFAERFVQLVGLTLGKTSGALFSFRVPASSIHMVTGFLAEMLWMTKEEAQGGT